MSEDLDDLLRRAAQGDRAAFAAFYDATAPRAHRVAMVVAGDPVRAREAMQAAYATAWRTAAAPRESWSACSWLLALVQHRAGTTPSTTVAPPRTSWRIPRTLQHG